MRKVFLRRRPKNEFEHRGHLLKELKEIGAKGNVDCEVFVLKLGIHTGEICLIKGRLDQAIVKTNNQGLGVGCAAFCKTCLHLFQG